MKQFSILTALLFFVLISSAQFENIDLSEYKLPDIKRHQLDFNFSANQNGTHTYKPENTNPTFDFEGEYSIDYNYYLNKRKKIINFDLSGNGNLKLDREKEDKIAWKKSDWINFWTNANYTYHFYFDEDRFYLNLNPTLHYTFYNYHYLYPDIVSGENTGNDKSNNLDNDISFNAGFGVGYGRIEPISDLRHSIYILEDLLKNKSLKRIPNKEEVFAVASKMSQLKNKRFFDHRLRKIYELKSLDSLLNKLDLIESSDAVYFTSLNDFWVNFSESRYNGSEVGLVVIPGIRLGWDKDIDKSSNEEIPTKSTSNYSGTYIGGQFYFNHYKPLGLNWQRFLRINSSINQTLTNHTITSSYNYEGENFGFNINCSYGYNWYLNTRTKLSFNIQGMYDKSIISYDNREDELNRESFYQYFNLNFYYYISPQLRLSFNSSAQYSNLIRSYTDDSRNLYFSSNIGFTYMIF